VYSGASASSRERLPVERVGRTLLESKKRTLYASFRVFEYSPSTSAAIRVVPRIHSRLRRDTRRFVIAGGANPRVSRDFVIAGGAKARVSHSFVSVGGPKARV